MDGGRSALHADGGELGHLAGYGHELGDGWEGLAGEGGVESGEDDAFAAVYELKRERGEGGIEELGFVDANDFDFIDEWEERGLQVFDGGDGDGVQGLRTVRGDGRAVVSDIEVGLEADHAASGDLGALEAADEFL